MRQTTTLAALDHAAMAEAFNRVYEGYVVPFVVDEGTIRHHVSVNDIALADSPLWLDDAGEVVGLAALGVRDRRGWIGGFGIARAHRGRGLGRGLMDAALDSARRLPLDHIQLEVLTNNPAAIHLYLGAGFSNERTLRIFVRAEDAPPLKSSEPDRVWPAPASFLLTHHGRLHPATPSWQREDQSLARIDGLQGLALGEGVSPDAYLLYQTTEHSRAVRIWDVGGRDPAPIESLLRTLAARLPGRPLQILNEPEESPVCVVLERLGWTEIMRQYEMHLALD